MDDKYDFESNDDLVSNEPTKQKPVNNGYVPNGYTPNSYNSGNQNNGNGGVPLIAIIGIMALIILMLIVYIIYKELSPKDANASIQTSTTFVENVNDEQDFENEEDTASTSKETNTTNEDDDVEEYKKNKDDKVNNKNQVDNEINVNEDKVNNENKIDNEINVGEDEEEQVNNENSEEEEITVNTPISTTNETISDDWKSEEFIFDGKKYTLNTDYKNLTENGWSVDFVELGYENGYILNKNDKTYSTTDLENENYSDANVNIGFINLGEMAVDVSEAQFWAISVDNSYSDTPVDFELPGGIKNGSTLEEVENAYGKPEDEDNIYRSESLGYWEYTYEYDYTTYLRLTIYDDGGIKAFDYKTY